MKSPFQVLLGLSGWLLAVSQALAWPGQAKPPGPDQTGIIVHPLSSPHQPPGVTLRVLLPEDGKPDAKLPLVLLLPVEKQGEHRYGDGIQEIRRRSLHRRYPAIYVEPTFAQLPWYANHPSNRLIAQERHLMESVLPFLDKTYPNLDGRRYLVGFSKSGWGALVLILRHPASFQKAVAFDAPLMMDRPGLYGSGPIFGDKETFATYHLNRLWETADPSFARQKRVILLGYGNFRADHQKAHERLEQLGIQHEFRDGPKRSHDWHSGWVEEGLGHFWNPSPR